MAATATSKRRRARGPRGVHKPRGVLHGRVQKAGPQHFGMVCVDCAKARSKWMICDFYGRMLRPPEDLLHGRAYFQLAVCQVREAIDKHRLRDLVVAIERTGNYHLPVKRAFSAAGFECRIVHPFATKQFRQPADPGNKTDETDLSAIFRAATCGFGLIEPPLDPLSEHLRLLVRHRRDLVEKRSAVCCQLREHWEATLPGFASCFDEFWDSAVGLYVARHFRSPEAVREAGVDGLASMLRQAGHRCSKRTLQRCVSWAANASSPAEAAAVHSRIAMALDDDRRAKTEQIQALERDIAGLFVQTPYVLLLSIPGINVVSAAQFAGEMGPISHYAHAKTITGRAGIFPSRYQSDQVDCQSGPLIRCANRRLRASVMMIADNLVKCNYHFNALAKLWKAAGKDPRDSRVKVACRYSRIAFHMVAGRQVFHHPICRDRSYILDKLLTFHREHDTPPARIVTDLQAAIGQLPKTEYATEATPLVKQMSQKAAGRRRGPQPLGDILPIVLARLGVSEVQSNLSGDQGPS
jgi:transposase